MVRCHQRNTRRSYFSYWPNTVSVADNSDLLAVTVTSTTKVSSSTGSSGGGQMQGGQRQRRFLVVDIYQIVLVEPDSTRLGWGVATFVGFLQVIYHLMLHEWHEYFLHSFHAKMSKFERKCHLDTF